MAAVLRNKYSSDVIRGLEVLEQSLPSPFARDQGDVEQWASNVVPPMRLLDGRMFRPIMFSGKDRDGPFHRASTMTGDLLVGPRLIDVTSATKQPLLSDTRRVVLWPLMSTVSTTVKGLGYRIGPVITMVFDPPCLTGGTSHR